MLRQMIVTVMGNVDSGKSHIIDVIKKTTIVKSEPGQITQSINAYSLSLDDIKKICRKLLEQSKKQFDIPGILFIDTPGHAAFSNLRKRGGSLADIAILVIDINEGLKPQTYECIEILKEEKTPFIIALNKIDLITGWYKKDDILIKNIDSQNEDTFKYFNNKFYDIVAKLSELGFNSERFDRIDNFTKQITIVPISAKTEEGIPELLMVVSGLAQKYLENCLKCDTAGPGKGTILEINEEKGLGKTMNVIIYDGSIKIGDEIVIGTLHEPVVSKVKCLFEVEKNKLKAVKDAHAAVAVKIVAPEIDGVISGMPLAVVDGNVDEIKNEIQKQIKDITFEIDDEGIVIKADSIGSLEALINMLKERKIKIKLASIGEITKKDIAEASSETDSLNKVILGFNIKGVNEESVKIICSNVIYSLVEDFDKWHAEEKNKIESETLSEIVKPFKIKVLKGYVFRQSNPAVVGVEVLGGVLKSGISLIKDDKKLADIKTLESEGKTVSEAKKDEQVAISLPGITIGRQISEEDVLYSDLSENNFRKLKEFKKYLSADEVNILKEIAEIKRKKNSVWGV